MLIEIGELKKGDSFTFNGLGYTVTLNIGCCVECGETIFPRGVMVNKETMTPAEMFKAGLIKRG